MDKTAQQDIGSAATTDSTTTLPETHEFTKPVITPQAAASLPATDLTELPPAHEVTTMAPAPVITSDSGVIINGPIVSEEVFEKIDTGIYDVIVVGGGPAGAAAAVYCGRKMLKTLLITENFNGQSVVSGDIQNWIGEEHISGLDLAKKLETHVRSYSESVEVKNDKVTSVKSIACTEGRICDFEVATKDQSYKSKSVIIASGARRRRLNVTGEDKFDGKGISFCSTCDAPLFKDKKVVIVGGGNAGFEAAHDLLSYASEIYILDGGSELKADMSMQDEVKRNPKLKEIILNAKVKEVVGETLVTGLKYEANGQEKTLEVGGIFIEVGSVPNSEIAKNLVQIDDHGQIMINFQHARTSHPGVFAAGDVTNDPYKQNMISAGDGVRAALAAYSYLHGREKVSPSAEH